MIRHILKGASSLRERIGLDLAKRMISHLREAGEVVDLRAELDANREERWALAVERDGLRAELARVQAELATAEAAYADDREMGLLVANERDDLARRYTALRSAAQRLRRCLVNEGFGVHPAAQAPLDELDAALAGKPLPDVPQPCCDRHSDECGKTGCCWQCPAYWTGRPLTGADHIGGPTEKVRPVIDGDHPADPAIQGWAGIVEKVTRERDRLQAMVDEDNHRLEAATRERDTLRRELADADREHDAVIAELKARHREVLAERDETIARLRDGLTRYRDAYRFCPTTNQGTWIVLEADPSKHAAVLDWEKVKS